RRSARGRGEGLDRQSLGALSAALPGGPAVLPLALPQGGGPLAGRPGARGGTTSAAGRRAVWNARVEFVRADVADRVQGAGAVSVNGPWVAVEVDRSRRRWGRGPLIDQDAVPGRGEVVVVGARVHEARCGAGLEGLAGASAGRHPVGEGDGACGCPVPVEGEDRATPDDARVQGEVVVLQLEREVGVVDDV